MTGIVDFRNLLIDENGGAITSTNPLPTTGGGGGGTLSDTVFVDSTGQLFVYRDTGSGTPDAFAVPSWAPYTPSGTVSSAGGSPSAATTGSAVPTSADYVGYNVGGNLVGVSADTPFPVSDINHEDLLLMLTRILSAIARPVNYDASLNRERATAIIEAGTVTTVTTVSTVTTVTNMTNFGTGREATEMQNNNNRTAWALQHRARIT